MKTDVAVAVASEILLIAGIVIILRIWTSSAVPLGAGCLMGWRTFCLTEWQVFYLGIVCLIASAIAILFVIFRRAFVIRSYPQTKLPEYEAE